MKVAHYRLILISAVLILLIYFIRKHVSFPIKAKVTVIRQAEPYRHNYVHICMAFDEIDIIGAIAAINSIQMNTRHHVYFHIVTDSNTEPTLRSWIDNSSLKAITYEIIIFNSHLLDGKIKIRGVREDLASAMNYARYYYTELFPSLHGKVIHVDSDTITQGDVYELLATELEPGHIAGFSNDCTSSMKRFSSHQNVYASFINFNHKIIHSLHLKPNACSFNVGVYIFNADLWREHNVTNELEYWLELNTREELYGSGRAEGGSQPPMLIVFYDKYTPISPFWNLRYLGLYPKARYSEHFVSHGKLLHWNGPYKPWNGVAQYTKLWDKYYIPDPSGKFQPVRRMQIKPAEN